MSSFRYHTRLALALSVFACTLASNSLAADTKPKGPSLLARATEMYDDQRYEESIQVLSAALVRPSATTEEKIAVYKLMGQNYILLRRDEEAESAFRALLVLAPEYRLPSSESPRFRVVFDKVKAKWDAEGRPGMLKPEAPPLAAVKLTCKGEGVAKNGEHYPLEALLTDTGSRAKRLSLFTRSGGKGKFVVAWKGDVESHNGKYNIRVASSAVHAPLLEYYVEADDAGGLALASCGDATQPVRVAVPESKSGSWVPWAVGGVLGAGAIVGGLWLAGVFSSDPPPSPGTRVHIGIGEAP